jgi:nickel transport protein
VADAERRLSSMKYAKALLYTGGGDSDVFQTVVGHQLELVPLSNPFALKPNETLRVRVYFEGKPLAGAAVEIGDGVTPRKEEEIPRYNTNSDGIAEVPIHRPGLQLLVVEHNAPPLHADLCDSDVSIATLSFMLPARQ